MAVLSGGFAGRIGRRHFLLGSAGALLAFALSFTAIEPRLGSAVTLLLYPPLFWAAASLAVRRLHDRGRSARWLLALLLPLAGPLWLGLELGLLRGNRGDNRFGADPGAARDYLRVA